MTTALPLGPGRRPVHSLVLADLVPHPVALSRTAVDALLVLSGTLVVTVLAQVAVPLPFTPVPISLATLGVLLTGAALGTARGSLSIALYVLVGMLGAPVYGDGGSGWAFASFGYVLAYLPAAALAGHLARRGQDKTPLRSVGLVLLASAVVYAGGVPWLMAFLDVDLATALRLGVAPFLVGDTVKALLVAGVLPSAWALVRRARR